MRKYSYQTIGTCSREIILEVDGDIVKDVEFIGGCPGNLIGLSTLIRGAKIDDLVGKLKGIECRNGTSCPDQLARALEMLKNKAS